MFPTKRLSPNEAAAERKRVPWFTKSRQAAWDYMDDLARKQGYDMTVAQLETGMHTKKIAHLGEDPNDVIEAWIWND